MNVLSIHSETVSTATLDRVRQWRKCSPKKGSNIWSPRRDVARKQIILRTR